jgi:hypothetical protein
MDLPYNVSDFAFPSRWDSGSGPDVVERAGRPEIGHRTRTQADRDKASDSGASRGSDRFRTIYRGREREYSLRDSEVRTLTDVGRFRVVPTEDLARFGYQGDQAHMEAALISVTVNGQAALFERHPHRPVNVPVKSSGEGPFQGDFTSRFSEART